MHRISIFLLAFILSSLCTSAKVVLSEDFNKFTDGTEGNPSTVVTNFDNLTQMPGWSGISVMQAGGAAYLPVEAQLTTPAIDLGANGGNYCISFKAKSATPGAFFFLMDSNGGYMSGDISIEWAT